MLAATLRTAGKRSGLLASLAHREFAAQAGESKTILAVLYKAGDASKEKRLLGEADMQKATVPSCAYGKHVMICICGCRAEQPACSQVACGSPAALAHALGSISN